jgi:hypothetical protein
MSQPSAKSYFGMVPVKRDWPTKVPSRLVMLRLEKGNDPLSVIYGAKSLVTKTGGIIPELFEAEQFVPTMGANWSEAEVESLVRRGFGSNAGIDIRHGQWNRPRTALSLGVQGNFFLALYLDNSLRKNVRFAAEPFGVHPDYSDQFSFARTFAGWIAVVAIDTNPLDVEPYPTVTEPLPFNINLEVTSGHCGHNHYAGVQAVTPLIIDPDLRWPDGTTPPGLPPPPA